MYVIVSQLYTMLNNILINLRAKGYCLRVINTLFWTMPPFDFPYNVIVNIIIDCVVDLVLHRSQIHV